MKNLKTSALAGILAVSTSFAVPAQADTIGCSGYAQNTSQVVIHLEQVIAALQLWLSNNTAANPNHAALTNYLANYQSRLDQVLAGNAGSKFIFFSYAACNTDVSPA